MSGPKAGNAKSHHKVIAVLHAAGKSVRAADLAEKAGVTHANLSKVMDPLIESGAVVRCKVSQPRGRPTYEYRIGSGKAPTPMRPLDPKRHGVAIAPPGRPLPVTTAARHRGMGEITDSAMLERIQAMSADAFGDYVAHLSRVWAYGQTRMTA